MQSSPATGMSTNNDDTLETLLMEFSQKPTDAGICDRIGALYLKNKKYPYARAYLEKALQLQPDFQSTSLHLSMLSTIEETSLRSRYESKTEKRHYPDLHSYNTKQTILFIGDHFYPPVGGAEKSALTLMQEFQLDGHRCLAVCKGTDGECVYNGIKIKYLSHPGLIEHIIFQVKPSLIITQLNWAYHGIALAKKHHIPGILFVRSYEYFCATPIEFDQCDKNCVSCQIHQFNRTIIGKFKSTIEDADAIVCNSEFMRKVTLDFYGRDSHVVFPAIAFDEHEVESANRKFIIMNQPEVHKGGELFFKLAQRMSDQKFMTVGRGEQVQLPNCICYGQTSPLLFFQHARLLLVPSIWPEPFGRIAVEAMRNGIPVIASNSGGLPEIVKDCGILVDNYRDIHEWETAIRRVLDNPALYDTLSAQSRERSRLFECQLQMKQLRPIIDSILELTSDSSDRRILDFYNKQYETTATYSFLFNHRRERLEGLCNMVKNKEFFLDIGCADGAHMEVLHQRKITGVGIDVSVPNIMRGLKQFPHLHFIHGFAEMIPFTDDFFDIVIMGDLLEHLREPRVVIHEVFRVAKSLAACVPIGEKTLEHISPYPTIDSVTELFNNMDVSIEWYASTGEKIQREKVVITETKPWVFIRVERNSTYNKCTNAEKCDAINAPDQRERHEIVRDEWDGRTITRDYQEVTRFYSTAKLVEGPLVLEMACGNGDMSVVIAKTGVSLSGIDIMSKGVAWARKTALAQGVSDRVNFEVRDASNCGFPDNHFDTVIIPELIEHIKDPHGIIAEALRVTKPGGLILISVPDGPDPNPDHIRCFFRETLRLELAQFTNMITWQRLPFKRWLIGTFRKSVDNAWSEILPADKILSVKDEIKDAPVNSYPLPGFNIIGPVGAGNEFGARIRGFVQSLLECGYPVAVHELPVDGQQGSVNPFRFTHSSSEPLPYAFNLFCLNPLLVNRIFSSAPSWLRLNNRLNVCLPDIPSPATSENWLAQLNRMDAVIALNSECRSIISKFNATLPVISIEIPPYTHKKGYYQRVNFGISRDTILFVSYVDMQQPPQSQNVDHIINAVRKCEHSKMLLAIVLDCTSGMNHEYLRYIKNCIQNDTKIRLFEGIIGREDMQSLFEIADFGLNCTPLNAPSPWIMEMMSNGKSVITLELPWLSRWIHPENALCIPVELHSGKHENNFRSAIPKFDVLLDTINNCCRFPERFKQHSEQAVSTITSMRQQFRNGAGVAFVNTLIDSVSKKRTMSNNANNRLTTSNLRILFANRPDVFTNPANDTHLMEQLKIALEKKRITVDISTGQLKNLKNYDIIHAFNTSLSVYTDASAAKAISEGIPFVVTPLQEDYPRYQNKAMMTFRMFEKYISTGQPSGFFDKQFEFVEQQPAAPMITSPLAISHAAAVLVSGLEETMVIHRYFPSAKIRPAPTAQTPALLQPDPGLFTKAFNIKDFVLCIGRLEVRKNQLMLLKALENDNLPLVFVGDGLGSQPEYADLCRRYLRKGSTLFLDLTDNVMLCSAVAAAHVLCVPSWYELPGLDFVNTPSPSCPVVHSTWGVENDFTNKRFIKCEPDKYQSIRTAIFNGLDLYKKNDTSADVSGVTWDDVAVNIIGAYSFAIENGNNSTEPERPRSAPGSHPKAIDPSKFMEEVIRLIESSKLRDAVVLYKLQRPHVISVPELGQFDELMKKVKLQVQ